MAATGKLTSPQEIRRIIELKLQALRLPVPDEMRREIMRDFRVLNEKLYRGHAS